MKNNAFMLAAALGLSQAFYPKDHISGLRPQFSRPRRRKPLKNKSKRSSHMTTSKYMPHQGKQECARRVRQAEALKLKANK